MLPLLLSASLLAQSGRPTRPPLSGVPDSLYSSTLNLDTDSWKQPAVADHQGLPSAEGAPRAGSR